MTPGLSWIDFVGRDKKMNISYILKRGGGDLLVFIFSLFRKMRETIAETDEKESGREIMSGSLDFYYILLTVSNYGLH